MRKLVAMALLAVLTMAGVLMAAETVSGTKSVYHATQKTLTYEGTIPGLEKDTQYEIHVEWGRAEKGLEKGDTAKWVPSQNKLKTIINYPANPNPQPFTYPTTGQPAPTVAEAPQNAVNGGDITHFKTSLRKKIMGEFKVVAGAEQVVPVTVPK